MLLSTIRTDARYLISPQLTSTEYPDADIDRNVNLWYRTLFSWAVEDQGAWELRGDILYQDLQTGVTDYPVPSSLIRVYKGEVMYKTGGSFVPAEFISVQSDQAAVEGNASRLRDDYSNPTIELFGDILQLRPAPTDNVVNGFKIWAQVDFIDLDNTNNLPDFPAIGHRVLSVGAAMDYAVAEEMDKKYALLNKIMYGDPSKERDTGLRGQVATLFASRAGAQRDRLFTKKGNYA